MLTVAIGAFVFLAVTLAVIGLGRFLESRPSRDQRRASRRLRELGADPALDGTESGDGPGWVWGSVSKLGAWVVPNAGRRTANLRSQLALAGYRHDSAVLYFTGLQLVLVVVLALVCGSIAVAGGTSWKRALLWTAVGGGGGLVLPTFALSSRIAKRQQILRHALPDVLDIMVLSVEGGASLNAAISWATEEIQSAHPVFGAEMLIVQREMQLGLSAGEAFRAFADRCGLSEARDLAASLVQSERYGASIAKALRAYSDAARVERQLWAEEVAQKASVKIIFPMLLCIFPAIFIVLLGPAAMQMSKLFAR
jgi:tight adherence protein C